MRRIVVRVDDDPDGDPEDPERGWRVSIRPAGADADIVEPYAMAAALVDGRRVPAVPPRRPAPHEPVPPAAPHARLCGGDVDEVATLLRRIVRGSTRPDDVSTYGRWLHACLLGEAWNVIVTHPEVAAHQAVELALRWPATAADLHRMVWEAMRDDRAPLAGHPDLAVAITRLVPADVAPREPICGVPSVLFATSVALTDPTIRPGAMYMGLLRELDAAGHCRARAVSGVSADDLSDAVRQWTPDLVHLVAHGVLLDGRRGALWLRGEDGIEQATDAVGLIAALSAGGHPPTMVVLSACNTASPGGAADPTEASPLAAQLVAGGIPVVSAMAGEVRETACRLYTRRLAWAVHHGLSVVAGSAHGRRAALVASAAPSADIDWALPALFLAEAVDPQRPLVDARRAAELTRLADRLGLRREPVFIGRGDILARADLALRPDGGTGVIAVLAKGATSGLGGTRLLREIGWRALRDGHVPLLLGPFQETRAAPVHGRALVHAVLAAAVEMTNKMALAPFVPDTLVDDLGAAEAATLQAEVDGRGAAAARAAIHRRLKGYGERDTALIPEAVRGLLAGDLAQLATRAAAAWGDPFGAHSSVVLLCDDVHRWAAPPLSGLGFLRDLLDDPVVGLGEADRPVPVVFTASTTEADGKTVAAWCEQARSGLRVYELKDLTEEEREVGYQWVLLHPWCTKPEEDRALFGAVYTAARADYAPKWERILRRLGGRPVVVEDKLYLAADLGLEWETIRRDDDELAWARYVDRNPRYGL